VSRSRHDLRQTATLSRNSDFKGPNGQKEISVKLGISNGVKTEIFPA